MFIYSVRNTINIDNIRHKISYLSQNLYFVNNKPPVINVRR